MSKNMFDLSGKTALVTGGAGIIGTPVCHGLAAHGASVAIADINSEAAKKLAQDIAKEHGVKAIGVECDVSKPQSVCKAVETVCGELAGIDILHNNAATKTSSLNDFCEPFETYKLETWREAMSVNIDGMFLMAQAVGPVMLKQKSGGSIIQTTSIHGLVGPNHSIYEGSQYMGKKMSSPAVYATSKAAVIGLTRYLATYWADQGIRVNALAPGGVESGQNEAFLKAYSALAPIGRMAERNEMVGAVIYLASDASSYVTGQTLIVDGGWTAW